jgi:transketolase
MKQAQIDQLCIDTLRMLSIDAVQKANSGHPGTPLDAAPVAYCLWQRFLRYDPADPEWPNRDRFVLSAGHACALLYSLLHVCGVKAKGPSYPPGDRLAVTMDDLKTFRQAGSHCTGHPEYGWTSGVETTTGPLGQGAATSVGMAIAERWLAATYNRPDYDLFSHNVYALCSDGDMMEGISNEAASLAGHLKLSNLCWVYDDNHITIEGPTGLTFTEDAAARFAAYGWVVARVGDADDLALLGDALQAFIDTHDRPTLIIIQSHIGHGAPHKHDTNKAHGEPLGAEEVRLTKEFYGWDPDADFKVPDGVVAHFRAHIGRRGEAAHAAWKKLFAAYRAQYPDLAEQIDRMRKREAPTGWDVALPTFAADAKGLATRDSSGQVLNAIAAHMPWLLGGAADLSPSTKTDLEFDFAGDFQPPRGGAGRQLSRPEFPLRPARTCHVRHRQRHEPVKAAPLRFELPDLHRLLPCGAEAQFDDGASADLHLDPRFHQSRRGRADPSAHRADRLVPRHARHGRAASGGRERSRGGLEGHHADEGQAGLPLAHATGGPDIRSLDICKRGGRVAGRLCDGRRCRQQTRCSIAGDRQRSRALRDGL